MCCVILAFHRSIPKGVSPSKAFHLLVEYGSLQCSEYVTDGERAGRRPSSASPGYYQLLPQDIKATTLQKPRSIWVSNSTNSNGWVVMLSQARTSRVLSADICRRHLLQPETRSNGPPGWQIVLSSRLGCFHCSLCVLAAGGEGKAGAGAETSVEYSG